MVYTSLASEIIAENSSCGAIDVFTTNVAQVLGGTANAYLFLYAFFLIVIPLIAFGVGKNMIFGLLAALGGNSIIVILGTGGCISLPVNYGILSAVVYLLCIGLIIATLRYSKEGSW